MSRFVLIRACSTDYDEQGRIQGTLDMPLNAQGSATAQQLAAELRPLEISIIYSSPGQSAWQTASAIGEALDIKVKKIDSWQNVDHGLWQGMLVDDLRRKHPKVFRQWQDQPENVCPPQGETLTDAQDRARNALEKLVRKQKVGTVALVVPDPLGGILRSLLVQGEIGESCKRKSTCGSWELVDLGNPPVYYRGAAVKPEPVKLENNGGPAPTMPIGLN
jgi:broad specificity phosphatase PhoE